MSTGGAGTGEGTHLFVYGTLRRGGRANRLLAGCRFVRKAAVRGTLLDVAGRYPALLPEGEGEVWGEVWAVPARTLPALDRYEGVAEGLFERVRTEAGGVKCWTYVAGPALRRTMNVE